MNGTEHDKIYAKFISKRCESESYKMIKMAENEKKQPQASDQKMHIFVTALEGLGARDYNLPDVFAELIDNSIANDAQDIKIILNADGLMITDDGNGKDFQGVTNALNLGQLTTDPTSQSVYGLGIKQIWSWAGDKVTIASKKSGEMVVHFVTLSYKEMRAKHTYLSEVSIDTKDFTSFLIVNEEVCTPDKHFWQLQITDLKNKTLEVTKQTMDRLAQTYAPYIRRGIKISVNGQLVKKVGEAKLVFRENFSEPTLGFSGYWGIVEKGGKFGGSKYYGADTYHNERMITHADKDIIGIGDGMGCKITEHPSYYRLKCVVFFVSPSILDHNKVSNKNNWIKDANYSIVQDLLYKKVTQQYKIELEKIQDSEEKIHQREINDALAKTASPHLKDAFPEMKQPRKEYERAKKEEENNPEIQLIECEVRTRGDPPAPSNTLTGEYTGVQCPKIPHIEERPHIPIYIGNKPYELHIIETLDYPLDGNRYYYSKDDIAHIITLEINENRKDINGLNSSQRVPLLIEWIVEVIVRIMTPNLSTTDFVEEREHRLHALNADKWYADVEAYIAHIKRTQKT